WVSSFSSNGLLADAPLFSLPSTLRSFKLTAPRESYPLSLHDALPILYRLLGVGERDGRRCPQAVEQRLEGGVEVRAGDDADLDRSEEHTSELQSPYELVCRLLLEKKTAKTEETSEEQNDKILQQDKQA